MNSAPIDLFASPLSPGGELDFCASEPPPASKAQPKSAAKPPPVVSPPRATEPRRESRPLPPIAAIAGRTLPHSIEAEEQLLSCCLLDGSDTIARCQEAHITPSYFYSSVNGLIFRRLCELHQKNIPVELVVLAQELKSSGELEEMGGVAYLTKITGSIPTTAQAVYFLEKVKELHVIRELFKSATQTAEDAFNYTGGLPELLARVRAGVDGICDAAMPAKRGFTVWRPSDFAAYLPREDDAILGEGANDVYWREKQFALLLGPGGVGKSRLALNLARAQILQEPFVGFKTFGPPRRWLLLGPENSIRRNKEELAANQRYCTDEQRTLLDGHLYIQALVGEEGDSLSLDDPKAVSLCRATAATIKPDVLVIDPWESVILGGDCNDATATRESVRIITAMFSPHSDRFTLLVVHHAREGAEAARKAEGFDAGAYLKGSKTLRSMARFAINVAPEDAEDGGRVVLACGKINDGRKFSTRGAILNDETRLYFLNGEFDLDAWRADVEGKRRHVVVTVADCVEAVRAVYRNGEDVLTSAVVDPLREQTGASAKTIQRRLKEAAEGGYLRAGSKRGTWRLGAKPLRP